MWSVKKLLTPFKTELVYFMELNWFTLLVYFKPAVIGFIALLYLISMFPKFTEFMALFALTVAPHGLFFLAC